MTDAARVPPETYNLIVCDELQLATAAGEAGAGWVDGCLAEEFREFGQSGRVYDRSAVLAAIRDRNVTWTAQVEVLRMDLVGDGVVLLTYLSRGEFGNARSTARVALRSSLWRQRGETWQLLFHQGTPVPAPADPV